MKARLLLLVASLGLALQSPAAAIDISLAGNWAPRVGGDHRFSESRARLDSPCESTIDAIVLNISNTRDSAHKWRVAIRRADVNWPEPAVLWAKRTGAGAGAGHVEGGDFYQEVTGGDQAFFSGTGDRNGITISLRITGLSASVSPDRYLTSVIYTVVDEQ
jgi:hypothetical protein